MRFVLIPFLLLVGAEGKYRLCPNEGQPKTDESGALIQCLPGQDNNEVCGAGHVCFFSGFNYQCCPSAEEVPPPPSSECPSGSVAVLDSAGYTIKCSTLGNFCPKKNMFCHDDAESPFCCEPIQSVESSSTIPKEAEEFFKDDEETNIIVSSTTGNPQSSSIASDLSCPQNKLTLLGDDGEPIKCDGHDQCPSGYCHGDQTKICCDDGSNAGQNISDEKPKDTTVPTTSATETTTASTSPASTTSSSSTTTTTTAVASPSSSPRETKPVRIHAVKTKQDQEYKTHEAGGYSLSRTPTVDPKQQEKVHKEFVQHYLLDQIKRGWPYDDKYYRPENMAIIRQGREPSAIVNFN